MMVCEKLSICTKSHAGKRYLSAVEMKVQLLKEVLAASVSATPECILCEFVMSKLDKILGEQATEQEISADLEKVCDIMPSTVRGDCQVLVEKYAPEIVKILATYLKPSLVCSALKLCA